jgi:hypothetical protein
MKEIYVLEEKDIREAVTDWIQKRLAGRLPFRIKIDVGTEMVTRGYGPGNERDEPEVRISVTIE